MRRKFTFLPLWVFLLFTFPAFSQNTAIQFNGTDNFVTTTHDVIPTGGDGFTVEFWAFVPALATDGIAHEFMSQGDVGSGAGFFIGYDGTTGLLQAGDLWPNVNVVMPSAQWVHMAMVFDANFDSAAFYLNGIVVGNNLSYLISSGASHFQLGVQTDGSGFITGKMDEVRIWNEIRTPQQIKADMYGTVDLTASDLVAEYKMDEGSSTVVANAKASSGLDGTLQGTVNASTWVSSPVQFGNNGLTFDGINDNKVIIADTAGLYDLDQGTVEFWVNPSSLPGTSTVVGKEGPAGVRYSFDLFATQIGVTNSSGSNAINYSLPLGAWSHLAFVNDGSNTIVYVNGINQGTIPGGFGGAGTPAKQPMTIGLSTNTAGNDVQAFAGSVDEVRIWNTQRTQGQITTFMNNTMAGSESGLLGLFSFDQGVGGADNTGLITAVDNTANNNHGTLTHFDLTGSASNFVLDNSLTAVPLPITLIRFTATRQGNQALLQWQTGIEENTSNFIIERSADGAQFTTIGTIAAAGNSNKPLNYTFTDLAPGKNTNYYRLKQTDLDGHFTYSPVKVLVFPVTGRLVWYVTGSRTVQVNLQQGSSERYTLTDLNGHTLRRGQLSGGKTDISGYPAGLYIVKVITATGQIMNTKVLLP